MSPNWVALVLGLGAIVVIGIDWWYDRRNERKMEEHARRVIK